jgi:DNA topoisomerase-2
MPTIPMVLVNGTEGIGTGFSCYIPPFDPKVIKENIIRILNGEEIVTMRPWFRGFKGVVHEEEDTWMTEGVWKWSGENIVVTELPPGRWTQDYKEYLDALVEKKLIGGYTNNSTTDDVHFEITEYTGRNLLKDLKLRKTFRVSNMHLFHPVKGIHKYASPEEILKDFVELRMEHYKKRKAHLIDVLEKKATMCDHKSKFVSMVIEGKLVVFKRKKQDLETEIAVTFPKMDGTWDYLLNIKTVDYTEERVETLMKEASQATRDLEKMLKTDHIDMWKMDIKNI